MGIVVSKPRPPFESKCNGAELFRTADSLSITDASSTYENGGVCNADRFQTPKETPRLVNNLELEKKHLEGMDTYH